MITLTEADVGKEFIRADGRTVTMTTWRPEDISMPAYIGCYWYKVDGTNNLDPIKVAIVGRVEPALTTLPEKFYLNPDGNEELSAAIQRRLFELGYEWVAAQDGIPKHTSATYLLVGIVQLGRIVMGFPDDTLPQLTLQDLYTLPRESPVPKLEIAGRTLELKNGRVVGPDFDCCATEFKEFCQYVVKTPNLAGHPVRPELTIGCQKLDLFQILEAHNWAKDNIK